MTEDEVSPGKRRAIFYNGTGSYRSLQATPRADPRRGSLLLTGRVKGPTPGPARGKVLHDGVSGWARTSSLAGSAAQFTRRARAGGHPV